MIGNIIGALVGGMIDRSDGEGGIGGAAVGAIGVSVLKRVIPIAVVVGGALYVKHLIDNRASDA